MRRFREFAFRLQPVFRRRKIDAELSDELRIHLEMATEANVAAGMDFAAARAAAEREFGRLESIKQVYRDERGVSWVEHLIQDLAFGLRVLRKQPVFTAVVVTTLALGIGVNSALFSVLNALLLRAAPVHEPERLVGLFRITPATTGYNRISFPDYEALRDRGRSFSDIAAYHFTPVHFSGAGKTRRVWGQLVTPNYFSVLGIGLATGPGFSSPRDARAPALEAVLSHEFWLRQLEGDPAVVGQSITLNGESFVVVGVAPPAFRDLEPWLVPDLWVPIAAQPRVVPRGEWLDAADYNWLRVVARLGPEVDLRSAQAEASVLAANLNRERGRSGPSGDIALVPDVGLHPELRPMIRGYLLILLAAAAAVLLIVCVNLTTLWLARSMARWKEMGTRLALGATPARLFRQMMTESTMLAAIGGLLALALIPLLLRAVEQLQSLSPVPAPVEFRLDYRVFLFSGAVSLFTGVLFGSLPAWWATKTDVLSVMKHGAPHERVNPAIWRSSFVALQIAGSFTLLVCAALFTRSLQQMRHIDLGFSAGRTLVASIDLGLQAYSRPRGEQFLAEARRLVTALPGVESVGLSDAPPLNPLVEDTRVWIASSTHPSDREGMMVHFAVADPDYFSALGLPVVRGRAFSAGDGAGSEPVAIVNETFARLLGGDPLAGTVRLSPGGPAHRIVGVARDSKYLTLGEPPRPFLYLPLAQNYRANATLIVRASISPEALLGAVTRAVHSLDQDIPVQRARTLDDHIASQHFVPQWAAVLLGAFATLALLLALLGIFGVTVFDTTQRTREFGVRIAFGATRTDILRLVVRKALGPVIAGALLGVACSFAAARLLQGHLYRVGYADSASYLFACALLGVSALAASMLPGWRATSVAPTEALRHE
jgi:predicted permease